MRTSTKASGSGQTKHGVRICQICRPRQTPHKTEWKETKVKLPGSFIPRVDGCLNYPYRAEHPCPMKNPKILPTTGFSVAILTPLDIVYCAALHPMKTYPSFSIAFLENIL